MTFSPSPHSSPAPSLIDELLIDAAVKIQLSPTMHKLAVERYETIGKWLDRPDSPLHGRIKRVYAQGSMAIGATIRTKEDDDLFDIDLIVEADWPVGTTPAQMLDLLFRAMRGERGSQYYEMTTRQTRCVTIEYAEMHLDITPMARHLAWPERGGHIAHAKEGEPPPLHLLVPANPWGFGIWFTAHTPAEDWFARAFVAKSYGRVIKADADPVPQHEVLFAKSMAVVALQLIKRHVYLVYGRRAEGTRRPPSVFISELVAQHAGSTASLIDELIHQVRSLRSSLQSAAGAGKLIDVRNPRLWDDRLTDRWPANHAAQNLFITDLLALDAALVRAKAETDITKLQELLGRLFGEKVAGDVVQKYYERAGYETKSATSRFHPKSATAVAGLSTVGRGASQSVGSHKFFGD